MLLEVACSPGNVTICINAKGTDLIITVIDLAPTMVKLARLNVPGVDLRNMDCKDF